MNEAAPSIVVRFDSARSADPPQSSGSTPARALRTLPDRGAGGDLGAALERPAARSSTPSGSSPASSAVEQGLALGVGLGPGVEARPATRRAAPAPRSTASRVCSRTSSATTKVFSGSKPSTSLTSRRARPRRGRSRGSCRCSACSGLGQPMIVFRMMIEGFVGLALGGLDGARAARRRPRRTRRSSSSRRSARASRTPRSARRRLR